MKYIANKTNETVAVLSRLKASLLPYQILLTKDNIKYDVSEDLAFFLTGAAKSLNTVMTIKEHNRASRQDLVELVSLACRNEMFQTAKNTLSSVFMINNTKIENISESLEIAAQKYPKIFSIFNAEFITKFETSIKKFFDAKNVYETLDCLLKNFDGLQQNYSRSLEDLYYRDPPLESLLDFASKYGDNYFDFNEDFNTAKEIANAALPEGKANHRILLSTALRVKGQQFDNVIILNTINDTWPKKQATTNEEYEAERRLFYVATTRSKKSLSMYYSKIYHGETTIISPFIHEGDYDK